MNFESWSCSVPKGRLLKRSWVTSSYPPEMAHFPAVSLLEVNWKVVLMLLLLRQKSTFSPSHCFMPYWTAPGTMFVHGVMLLPTRSE